MLWSASALNGYLVRGTDGQLGTAAGLMYDESDWTIRWLLVDTGNWLSGRRIPLPISVVGQPDPEAHQLSVNLTMKQVEESPDVDVKRDFSRKLELVACEHFDLPDVDDVDDNSRQDNKPTDVSVPGILWILPVPMPAEHDGCRLENHIHSISETTGGLVEATDGDIGHTEDFLVDSTLWQVRYLVVHASNWWPDEKCLVSPMMIDWIDWARSNIHLKVTRQEVKAGPLHVAAETVDRAFEELTHSYFGIREAQR